MTATPSTASGFRAGAWAALGARFFLGAVFLVMGAHKALHPPDFLGALHQYHLFGNHVLLNLTASVLPWMEILCGLFLLAGIAVRGCAVVTLVMLTVFSLAVLMRALALQQSAGLLFCAVRFDCGCGSGEVFVCRKLLENVGLLVLAVTVAAGPADPWRLRHRL